MSELQLRWQIEPGMREKWRAQVCIGDGGVIATVFSMSSVIDGVRRWHWYGWLHWRNGRRGITEIGQSTPADAMRDCEAALLRRLEEKQRRDVVREQWLRTAVSAHERMQLRAAWRLEDAAGEAA